jgi:hypothetical protein
LREVGRDAFSDTLIRPTFPIKECCLWWINSLITNFSLSQSQFDIWIYFGIVELSKHYHPNSWMIWKSWNDQI